MVGAAKAATTAIAATVCLKVVLICVCAGRGTGGASGEPHADHPIAHASPPDQPGVAEYWQDIFLPRRSALRLTRALLKL
jgi:hypothetical protein